MAYLNLTETVNSIVMDVTEINGSQYSESRDLLTHGHMVYVYTINLAIICGTISLVGIVTNSINIVVFLRQGFQETINISLFALAISDLFSLISLLFVSICYNPFFMYSDLPVLTAELQHVAGGWTHIMFVRITGLITVFITFERCLCITFPLKVKTILNRKRVKIIIIMIYAFVLLNLAPLYFGSHIGMKYISSLNKTLITNVYNEYRPFLETFTHVFQPFYPIFCFSTVVICSYILIMKLNARSKWIQTNTSGTNEQKSMVRDRQIVKMVVYLAIIFIIGYTPSLVLFILMIMQPHFQMGKTYENSFIFTCSICYAFEGINSSVNIFVYYFTSSNYRTHFKSLFNKQQVG